MPNSLEELQTSLETLVTLIVLRHTREILFASTEDRQNYQANLRDLVRDWIAEQWISGKLHNKEFVNRNGWFHTSISNLLRDQAPCMNNHS